MDIGIIGGTGGIGKRFAALFQEKGHPVHVCGRRSGPDYPELARICPIVITAVPMGVSGEVIGKIGPLMDRGSLLMDLGSLQAPAVRLMMEASSSEVIGMHPLFGPDVSSLSGQNIVLCPGRGEKWLAWLKAFLEDGEARVSVIDPDKQDEIMALVQGLNHLNTILMGLVLRGSGSDSSALDGFSTPLFRRKAEIVEKVFRGNARLYAELIALNPNMKKILDLYAENLAKITGLVERKNITALMRVIEDRSENRGKGGKESGSI